MITIVRGRKVPINNNLPFLKSYKKWLKDYNNMFPYNKTPEVNLRLWETFWKLINEQNLTFPKYYYGHK